MDENIKFNAFYSNGDEYVANCDGNSTFTQSEAKPSGYDYTLMTRAVIGDCVNTIDVNTFSSFPNLASIDISDNVEVIKERTFWGCSGLTDIHLPDSLTSIEDILFRDCTSLEEIVIPENVEYIGVDAFRGCKKLSAIVLPDSLTYIDALSFEGCISLEEIEIPNNVEEIGDSAFNWCSFLTDVVIGSGIKEIGGFAFSNCKRLESITIKALVPPILQQTNTFFRNDDFTMYVPSESLQLYKETYTTFADRIEPLPPTTDIKYRAIYSDYDETHITCDGNTTLTSSDTRSIIARPVIRAVVGDCVTRIDDFAFENFSMLNQIVLSDNIKYIGDNSFYECSSLEYINLPQSLEIIGIGAFYNCTSLTNIEIPLNVKSINNDAFYGCSSLSSVTLTSIVPLELGLNAFGGVSEDFVIYVPCDYIDTYREADGWNAYADKIHGIPPCVEDIMFIADYSNGYHYEVKSDGSGVLTKDIVQASGTEPRLMISAEIGVCVSSISAEAFMGCDSLTNIIIPSTVIRIENSAFEGCSSLNKVELTDRTTYIGERAFCQCGSLTEIILPNSVSFIGRGAFEGCYSILSFTIPSSINVINDGLLYGCRSLREIYIPDNITSIGSRSFNSCMGLTTLTIGSGITTIGSQAFENCSGLQSIYIESENPPLLASGAFNSTNDAPIYVPCESVDTYKASQGWSAYSDRIFIDPSCETAFKMKAEYIGGEKYNVSCDGSEELDESESKGGEYNYRDMTSVIIDDCTETIGEYAFSDCVSLTSVSMNSSVEYVKIGSFSGCTSLRTITISPNVYKIDGYVFKGCTSLENIELPSVLTEISVGAFEGCTSLTSITIPDSVVNLGNKIFYGCENLSSANVTSGVNYIPEELFCGCRSLESIEFHSGVNAIRNRALSGCSSLTSITVNALTPPSLSEDALNDTNDCTIYVPCESVGRYKKADVWKNYASRIEGIDPCDVQYRDVSGDPYCVECSQYVVVTTEYSEDGGVTWEFFSSAETLVQEHSYECGYRTQTATTATTCDGCNKHKLIEYQESCDYGQSWTTTGSSIGELIEEKSYDCGYRTQTVRTATTCDSCNKYQLIEYQESCDGGITWVTTGASRGDLIEAKSYDCGYRTQTVRTATTCDGCSKYQLIEYQESCDYGQSWTTISSSIGELIEEKSYDCGYRTQTVTTATTCVGYDKYQLIEFQESCDGGITWATTGSSIGELIEEKSYDCGYTPVGSLKLRNHYESSPDYSINCNRYDDGVLTMSEVRSNPNDVHSNITSSEIGECVTKIGTMAFSKCISLSSVTFIGNNNVTEIGDSAFIRCYDLSSISLPSSVNSIGNYAFAYCCSIENSNTIIRDGVTRIGDGAFYNCESLTSITIPNSAEHIGQGICDSCYNLKTIIFNSGIQICEIPNNAFSRCEKLTSITIPTSVKRIGGNAFAYCSGLTTVNLNDGLEEIDGWAFMRCTSLTSIAIPSSVTEIGDYAFLNCTKLSNINIECTTPPYVGYHTFSNVNADYKIYVPHDSLDLYKNSNMWKPYVDRIYPKTT